MYQPPVHTRAPLQTCDRQTRAAEDRSWCAELRTSWKAIRKELHGSLDESLWTGGAYQASNEAYGKDWKIMGVLTEDKWQDEQRFKAAGGQPREVHSVCR